jgi:hypothetical protein
MQSLPSNSVLILEAETDHALAELRSGFLTMDQQLPVIIKRDLDNLDREHCSCRIYRYWWTFG